MKAATTIDEYIASFTDHVQVMLTKLYTTIKKAAPGAEEKMSYAIPTFFLGGKNLVHFAAFKSHIGFYPAPSGIAAFEKDLKPYKTSKGAVQFPLNEPLPLLLVAKMVKYRVKENSKTTLKKKPKP